VIKRKRSELSAEDKARLAAGYETSGLSRREYCQQTGLPITTLDYYRHRRKTKHPRLVSVTISQPETSAGGGFVLALANGRRIESGWGFAESGLSRLLRIAEQG
jgi:hypothetical protein